MNYVVIVLLISVIFKWKTIINRTSYLIFIDFSILKFSFTLFLEGDDNQSNEDVDEKEGENDEVDDVENGHLDTIM